MNIDLKKTFHLYSYLVVLIILNICPTQTKAYEILVSEQKIENYSLHSKFTAIGRCKSEHSRTYYAKVSGTVDSISIEQGKNISAGDMLITIDADIAQATKAQAAASLNSTQTTHRHNLALLDKKIISSEVVNKSEVALEIAKTKLINAENLYQDMIITAPYDGYIGVVNARVGDDVKVGDYLFSLVAKGAKTVFVELPENMYSKIDKNSLVYTYDSDNNQIQGDVIAVSDYLNDNGTLTVKLAFPADSKLIHGSYIETELIFDQHEGLAIPERALLKNNNGNFIYKITEGNKAQQVYITTGERTDDMIEVLSGDLQIGDSLITSGLTKVFDGADVKIIDESSKPEQSNND